MVQNLSSLFVAEMGPLPLGLLTPFGALRALNLSGNHLDNITLQLINSVTTLEVSSTNTINHPPTTHLCTYYINLFISIYIYMDIKIQGHNAATYCMTGYIALIGNTKKITD